MAEPKSADRPAELDESGFNKESYDPDYEIGNSCEDCSMDDVKRGYYKGF